jgi:hypothetical protein
MNNNRRFFLTGGRYDNNRLKQLQEIQTEQQKQEITPEAIVSGVSSPADSVHFFLEVRNGKITKKAW